MDSLLKIVDIFFVWCLSLQWVFPFVSKKIKNKCWHLIYTLKKPSFMHIKEIQKKNSNFGFFRDSIKVQIYLIANLKEEWKKDESNVNNALFLYYTIKGVRLYAVKWLLLLCLETLEQKPFFPFFSFFFFGSPSSLLFSVHLLFWLYKKESKQVNSTSTHE